MLSEADSGSQYYLLSLLSLSHLLMYFNKSTIAEISRVLPHWFGMEVAIDNPGIATRRRFAF